MSHCVSDSLFKFLTTIAAGIAVSVGQAFATPITDTGETFHFRSVNGVNSADIGSGERQKVGSVRVQPDGANGTTGTATWRDASGVVRFQRQLTYEPRRGGTFITSPLYNPLRTGQWELDFSNDGDTAGPVLTPSIVGVEAMPFVNNIKVFGEGTTPTVTWEVPQDEIAARGLNIDWFSIVIRDKDVRRARPDGSTFADVIWQSNAISPNILGGQIPDGILEIGGDYVIEISMQDSRSNCFACFEDIQSNSLTFFDFTPLTSDPSGGAGVVLPTVGPDGIYRFTAEVSLGEALFIDPLVAIGYDYAIGVGDPNFASVLLPFVGDDLYELWLWDGFDYVLADLLDAGVEYFFGTGGVDRFRILGIETAAMLDPNNATAFVTGLTFTDDGLFTGTMTPITTFVPLPATLGLLLLGGLAMRRFA